MVNIRRNPTVKPRFESPGSVLWCTLHASKRCGSSDANVEETQINLAWGSGAPVATMRSNVPGFPPVNNPSQTGTVTLFCPSSVQNEFYFEIENIYGDVRRTVWSEVCGHERIRADENSYFAPEHRGPVGPQPNAVVSVASALPLPTGGPTLRKEFLIAPNSIIEGDFEVICSNDTRLLLNFRIEYEIARIVRPNAFQAFGVSRISIELKVKDEGNRLVYFDEGWILKHAIDSFSYAHCAHSTSGESCHAIIRLTTDCCPFLPRMSGNFEFSNKLPDALLSLAGRSSTDTICLKDTPSSWQLETKAWTLDL